MNRHGRRQARSKKGTKPAPVDPLMGYPLPRVLEPPVNVRWWVPRGLVSSDITSPNDAPGQAPAPFGWANTVRL